MQVPVRVASGGAPKVALPHILLHALNEAIELLVDLRTHQHHNAVSIAPRLSNVAKSCSLGRVPQAAAKAACMEVK